MQEVGTKEPYQLSPTHIWNELEAWLSNGNLGTDQLGNVVIFNIISTLMTFLISTFLWDFYSSVFTKAVGFRPNRSPRRGKYLPEVNKKHLVLSVFLLFRTTAFLACERHQLTVGVTCLSVWIIV